MILDPNDKRPPPSRDPLERPAYYPADVHALRALMQGTATPDQQRRVCDFLMHHVCATYDETFRPESERLTAFASGKRWVGLTLAWFFNSAPVTTDKRRRAQHGEQP